MVCHICTTSAGLGGHEDGSGVEEYMEEPAGGQEGLVGSSNHALSTLFAAHHAHHPSTTSLEYIQAMIEAIHDWMVIN